MTLLRTLLPVFLLSLALPQLAACSFLLSADGDPGDGDGDTGDGDGDTGDGDTGDGDGDTGDGDAGDGDGDAGDGDGDTGDGDGDTGDGDGDTGDGDGDPECGDGTRDPGEVCDGDDFGGLTCAAFGLDDGTLACVEACAQINLDGCGGGCVADCADRECGPDPACGTSCGDCSEDTVCSALGQCVGATSGLQVRLVWSSPEGDLDLHLLRQNGAYCSEDSCYYGNCKENAFGRPDWDESGGPSDGDPILDIDDLSGYGPEQISLPQPADGVYEVGVHVYSMQANTLATVAVLYDGVQIGEGSQALNGTEMWDAARIAITNGVPQVAFLTDVESGFSCNGASTPTCSSNAQCSNTPWPNTTYCDLQLQQCVSGCQTSANCPEGGVCDGQHNCVPECADGEDCTGGPGAACTSIEDCQAGLVCHILEGTCAETCGDSDGACNPNDDECCPITGAMTCTPGILFSYCE